MSCSMIVSMVPVPNNLVEDDLAQSIARLKVAATALDAETLRAVGDFGCCEVEDAYETDDEYDKLYAAAVVKRIGLAIDYVLGREGDDITFIDVMGQQYAVSGGESYGDMPTDAARHIAVLDVSGLMNRVERETIEARFREKHAAVDTLLAQMANDLQPVLLNASIVVRAIGGDEGTVADLNTAAQASAATFEKLRAAVIEALGPVRA